jgi:hypothetical protein
MTSCVWCQTLVARITTKGVNKSNASENQRRSEAEPDISGEPTIYRGFLNSVNFVV